MVTTTFKRESHRPEIPLLNESVETCSLQRIGSENNMQKQIFSLLLIVGIVFGIIGGQVVHADTTYKVKNGDTLWDIANVNDVSIENLMTWNELGSTLIYPGQTIHVGSKKEVYVVKKGDTLSQIADAHRVGLTELKRWNNITGHLIFPGDELTINGNKTLAVSSNKTKSATPSTQQGEQPKNQTTNPQQNNQTKKPTTQSQQPTTAASGKEMTVTATAYTAYCQGCSGTTYTGINLRANPNQKVIAVDPSVIPLGSRVWVEGYGEAIAGDIGGAIKGNIIDVFLEQKQDALNWGRRTVKIKVLD